MPELIQDIFLKQLPTIFIMTIILISVRCAYLMRHKKKAIIYRELLTLAFIIYILCLFYIVTYNDYSGMSSNNFIPFKEITRYDLMSSGFIKNILGNIFMFLPFGFFISLYIKPLKVYYPLVLTLIASLSIEFTQLATNRRVFDVDDIILNVCGGILGYFIYVMLENTRKRLPNFLKNDILLNTVVILGYIILFIYALNILGVIY